MGGVNRELGSPEGASEEDHSLLLDPGTAPEDSPVGNRPLEVVGVQYVVKVSSGLSGKFLNFIA